MTSDKPQWFWNAASDPFNKSSAPAWTAYSPEDNRTIEEQYKNKSTRAELTNHVIHFKERMQVHKTDFNRQRPIKREPKE